MPSLVLYAGLPFYHRLLRHGGFVAEAQESHQAIAGGDQHKAAAGISDHMLDEFLPIGSAQHCREHIAACCTAGVALPIVLPYPVEEDYSSAVQRTLDALAPR